MAEPEPPQDTEVTIDGEVWLIPTWAQVPGPQGATPARTAACRSCAAPVLWVITHKSGRPSPLNQDGTSHFSTCPQAERWRRS